MEGEDYGRGAIGEHAKGSCEQDEMYISGCREQRLDAKFFFELGKHGVSILGVKVSRSCTWHGQVENVTVAWLSFRDLRVTM